MWDLFISHASEDKDVVVRPLAQKLGEAGLNVWFDEQTLRLGDSLRRKIDEGLAESTFGVVVLSPHFFAKEWPTRELDGLFSREEAGGKVILPVWHNVNQGDVARRSPLAASKLAVSTSRGLDEVVRQILAVVRPGSATSVTPTTSLRFVDSLRADPVAAKVAVADVLGKAAAVEVHWPPSFDELLKAVQTLQREAERYHEQDSCFHGVDTEAVSNFIDSARLAVASALKIRGNVPLRVPSLIAGMSGYWKGMTFLIERSLVNFLTLANFDAQFGLAYCFRYVAVADQMPATWRGWFEPERTSTQRYAELFAVDEEMCSGRVQSISGVYINQYVWGPRWMVLEAARTPDGKPIANPWFVKYLIPQVELGLSWQPDSPVIEYREQAVVTKVVSESGEELY